MTHSKNEKKNHNMLSVNGFLVKVHEGIEFIYIKIGIGLPKTRVQDNKFLSQTEKELGSREVKWLNEGPSVRGGRAGLMT